MTDPRQYVNHPNVRAFAHVVRHRESSHDDSAYTIMYGGAHFTAPPWVHPHHGITTTQLGRSTACGAYQHLGTTWASIAKRYPEACPDFSPPSQDAGFVVGLIDRGALDSVLEGNLYEAIRRCRQEWTSLPGASEDGGRYSLSEALRVYKQCGGVLGPVAPPATPEAIEPPNPYDPYAPRPPRPSDPGPIFNPDQQAPDLGTAPTQPGDTSMIPALPVVIPILSQLLPMVLQLFAPRAQQQIQKITGQPAEVVQPFVQDLFNKAGELVGVVPPKAQIETDAQAVQVLAKLQEAKATNAALVQQLEAHALDYLDRLAPMFDRLAQADAAANAAAIEGRNAALERALRDPYDVAPAMVHDVTTNTRVIGGGLVIGIVAAIVAKGFFPGLPDYAAMLIPAFALLAGQISKERGAIIAYRFDGTPQSNTANALNQQIAEAARQARP